LKEKNLFIDDFMVKNSGLINNSDAMQWVLEFMESFFEIFKHFTDESSENTIVAQG